MDIWVAILLVVFGLLFLVLEVFVFPGVGVSGLVGIIALSVGVYIAFQLNFETGLTVLGGSVVGTSVMIYLSVKYDSFSMMSLNTEINSKVDVNHLSELKVGDTGTTISRLAPMGKARFEEMYAEVSSWDGFIDENTPIKIEKIKDNTIFVSPIN